jgi:toxin YoeB
MRSLVFEGDTWNAYEQLRQNDKKLHENLCKILKEMLRGDPESGIGKPEPLKHNLSGLWSRRLSQRDRIIYRTHLGSYERDNRLSIKRTKQSLSLTLA